MKTPTGLNDTAYSTAFSVFSTCNRAKSECVSDHYLLQCGLIGRRFRLFTYSMRRNLIVFSTITLFNMAKSVCVFDRCFLQGGERVIKSGGNGVRIIVFAARNARIGIAMRAFRRVFRVFSGLFDD